MTLSYQLQCAILPYINCVLIFYFDLKFKLRKEWYARIGGCTALRFMNDNYPAFFIKKHAAIILDSFIEVFFC